ncbi:epoxide hydrolase [Micromonospora sp. NBC_00362]|uniref:epoxide hydrolase family protein n=1 Tax=unclassified Micromonospora TaxID=2617518 RepID=UPI002258860B|nr:epoxide hydrolase family protein [Micromonospora sp. NBC_00362]MCX5121886.1 epoxide hydrolase [Micromonospora sp. NBC_00362]WTI06206.1 epoxide hydrolase [Micromonospora sp. NBC_00821]
MRPYQIDVPPSDIDDLRRRIAATRWPDEIPDVGWSRGVPVGYLRELAEYWHSGYDWAATQRRLNEIPQFVTEIDGAQVHFLHVRSQVPGATPLLLTHGWPSTGFEFVDIIDALVDPAAHGGDAADAFHVVVPTIPGYGFSGPTRQAGWDTERVARAWTRLMADLGYDRYVAQGGDWGSPISLRVGLADPEHVRGVHLNMCVTFPPPDFTEFAELSPADQAKLGFALDFQQDGMGWQKIQSTRPQTLSYGLTDSPVGQLAWIVEKFKEWSAADKAPEDAISREHILTTVTIFWLTATAGSSAQLYFESTHRDADFARTWGGPWPLAMPVGVAAFPEDAVRPVRRFAEGILPTLAHWSEYDRGGHFPALEQPTLLVTDLRTFVRGLPN